MAAITVRVETREGDIFLGNYPTVPTRERIKTDIHGGTNATSNVRLLSVVDLVSSWPNTVRTRHVEVARVENIIFGKVIFVRV